MNKVVHFEIPVDDLGRAKKFYSIFDWELQDIPGDMKYTTVTTVPVDEKYMPKEVGGINGGMFKRKKDGPTGPVVTINVDSIVEFAKKIKASGGKMTMGKTEIPQMGFYAYFTDTEGNVVGLWENLK